MNASDQIISDDLITPSDQVLHGPVQQMGSLPPNLIGSHSHLSSGIRHHFVDAFKVVKHFTLQLEIRQRMHPPRGIGTCLQTLSFEKKTPTPTHTPTLHVKAS